MTKQQKLLSWLNDYSKAEDFSGIVQVAWHGDVVFCEPIGYADRENKILNKKDTLFKFYSLTKQLTAISIMQLYEQGKISLDDHPGKYIECAKGLDERLTIRNIMQHTSGLEEIASAEALKTKGHVNMQEKIRELVKEELLFAPGTSMEYTNTNFIILSLIVEKFAQMSLKDYFEKVLFVQLGMKTAFCDIGDVYPKNMAVGYEKVDGKIVPGEYTNMEMMFGAGFAVGSVDDVMCLYYAMKNKSVLKPETWELVFTCADVGIFGFGCIVFDWNGKPTYQNNGGFIGFRSLHRYIEQDDFDIIILSNAGYGEARDEISEEIYNIYFGETDTSTKVEMDKGFV